jgi:Uma2 family endonuclease
MSSLASRPDKPRILYPDGDGEPMAENTLQFQWIVTIQGGLDALFRSRPDVFVAGDLLWYPVEGSPEIRMAPDAMAAFGRPKGRRGSYKQWVENNVAPQVVFEVLSPGNRAGEMERKRQFYERYGVDEYYIYDPDNPKLTGWRRVGPALEQIPEMNGWVSPLLDIRFDLSGEELRILRPDGRQFATYLELEEQGEYERQAREQAQQRAEHERQAREQAQQRAEQAQKYTEQERHARELAEQKYEQLAAQLRALGVNPET